MRSKRTRESSRLPVLALGTNDVEWLPADPGEHGARVPYEARRPAELAAAARAAFERSAPHTRRSWGRRTATCILALGPEFVRERLIELPPLPPRDRSTVLRRKAAALAQCAPEDVIFSASLQANTSGDEAGAQELDRWLIVALRRAVADELLSALRARGIHVTRAVSLRLAPLREALARRRVRDLDSGCVVVAVEPQATTVSLVAGAALVSQSTLTGSVAARPKLARALLQEIRSIDSFWRKTHRGDGVAEVAWIGLAAERGEPMRAALQTALPEARVHALGIEGEPVGAEAELAPGRVQLLSACRRREGFVLDLGLAARRSPAVTAAWSAAAAAVFLLLGFFASGRLRGALEQLEHRNQSLRREQQNATLTLEQSARARSLVDGVRARFVRAEEAARVGLPFERIVEGAFSAFGDDGALLSLAISTPLDGAGAEVVIAGLTDSHPLRGARKVARIAEALAATPGLDAVRIEPPTELPGSDMDGLARPFPFVVRMRTAPDRDTPESVTPESNEGEEGS